MYGTNRCKGMVLRFVFPFPGPSGTGDGNHPFVPGGNIMIKKNAQGRIWELDFLRGTALILMVYFHVIVDLKDMYNMNLSYLSGVNYYIGKISAILFMLLAGISSSLSRSNVKRGIRVFAIALVISLVTHLYGPEFGIKFGILHFLGICMLLYPLMARIHKYLLIVIGTGIILLGNVFLRITPSTNILFPLGIYNASFSSADYYPLVPWMGVFIYGIVLGKLLYSRKRSLFPFEYRDNIINMTGRNTLLIYVIHQPVILLVLYILKLAGLI